MPIRRVFFMSLQVSRTKTSPPSWSVSVDFFEDTSGFNSDISNIRVCVCEACHVSIRKAMKCTDEGEQYQLRRLKSKKVSKCSCKSLDIKAERQDTFTCDSIVTLSWSSCGYSDPVSQHKQCIRSTVWENIEFEDKPLDGTGSAPVECIA